MFDENEGINHMQWLLLLKKYIYSCLFVQKSNFYLFLILVNTKFYYSEYKSILVLIFFFCIHVIFDNVPI